MFEQERFIGRLQRHVMTEARVLTCFLSGSFGRRADDAFSDVDIALVYGLSLIHISEPTRPY